MEDLVRQAFLHVEKLGPHVAEGHYDLISPDGAIILPKLWETTIQPGWSISMHMWPMPEPRPRPFPNKPGFPPTPADSRDRTRYGGYAQGVPPPPPPPSNWPGDPTVPRIPPRGPGSPPLVEKKSVRPPPSGHHKDSAEKNRKESRAKKSSTYSDSTASDDYDEELIEMVSKLAKARRVYKVGRMGSGSSRAIYQISPRKEGLQLLNEYGRKFIAEARKVHLQSSAD